MTYEGLFEKCQTLEELIKARDNTIALASNPFDDEFITEIIFADINKAFLKVCEQKGWHLNRGTANAKSVDFSAFKFDFKNEVKRK